MYAWDREGQVVGVFCFIEGEDPNYARIEDGVWLNDRPYGQSIGWLRPVKKRVLPTLVFVGVWSGVPICVPTRIVTTASSSTFFASMVSPIAGLSMSPMVRLVWLFSVHRFDHESWLNLFLRRA